MRVTYLRDCLRRRVFVKTEKKRMFFKAICKSKLINKDLVFFIKIFRTSFFCNLSYIKLKNFCNYTYKSHAIYKFFGVERSALRDIGHFGIFIGLRKKNW